MTTPARQLHTLAGNKPGHDPGAGQLSKLLAALECAGLKPLKAAVDAAEEARRLGVEAVQVAGDGELSKPERVHRRDRLSAEAGAARSAALKALAEAGGKLEAAAGKIVGEARARIATALAGIPESVTNAEQAVEAGEQVAAAWATLVAGDRLIGAVWSAFDLARRLGVLPSPVTLKDLNPATSDLGFVLAHPGQSGPGYFVPVAHRVAELWAIVASTPASKMIRAGLTPDVIGADQARANLLAYAAAVVRGKPPAKAEG